MPDFTERFEKLEEQGKIILSGCFVSSNDPKYEYTECGAEYYMLSTGQGFNYKQMRKPDFYLGAG